MKKLLLLVITTLIVTTANSQGVKIYLNDNTVVDYSFDRVDSIVVYHSESNPQVYDLEAVDLALSVKWANMNVGAKKPEETGDYFSWGETKSKDDYSKETYQYYNATDGWLNIGENISGTEYDAANANMGDEWRMPTVEEIDELKNNCSWEWTTINKVDGYQITGKNGNSIFLPVTGYRRWTELDDATNGYYWLDKLYMEDTRYAYGLVFNYNKYDWGYLGRYRYCGFCIRAVSKNNNK